MKNRKRITQLLAFGPVIFIPAIIFFVGTLMVGVEKDLYERSYSQIEQEFLETEKSRIRSKVTNMVDLVSYQQSIINQKLHDRIQRRVEDANRIGITLYDHYVDKIPEAELKNLIIEALRSLVWSEGESFIWILDVNGNFQLAPKYLKHLEGSSIIDFEDATGRKIIREEIEIVKNQGQGFLWDTFTKSNGAKNKQFKQIAYVKNFGIYDWYLGSAEFLDTATQLTNGQLLEAINQVGKGESDYFFVISPDGELLLNYARPDFVGKNITESDDIELQNLYQEMQRMSQNKEGEFLSYEWINPRSGLLEQKLTFVKSVPQSGWIVGSGFYPKSLENSYLMQEQRLTNQHAQKMRHLNKLIGLAVLVSLLISAFISVVFYRVFSQQNQGLIDENNELKDVNLELENKVLLRTKELGKANSKLENLLTIDSLTQIANRDCLLSALDDEINRANRFNKMFSVALIDVDSLKNINDDYGQEVGNQILQQLATIIGDELRPIDLFGRFDGEEFLLIMPNTLLDEAFNRAENIRIKIEQYNFKLKHSVTVSLGVVQYDVNQQAQDLLKNVDIALFQAKSLGKNQTCKTLSE